MLRLPGLLECSGEGLRGLCAGDAELLVDDEEWHALDAVGAGLCEVALDLRTHLRVVQRCAHVGGVEAVLDADLDQLCRVADVDAVLEVSRQQGFLDGVGDSVARGQMQEVVPSHAVGDDEFVEVVVQTLTRGLFADVPDHRLDLIARHTLAVGEVFDLGAVEVFGQRRVQLVAVPGDFDAIGVREVTQSGFEAALADEAPGARDVRPDVNLHVCRNGLSPASIPQPLYAEGCDRWWGSASVRLVTRVHRLTRVEARRIAVRAQLLASPRPAELLDVVRDLGSIQVDLTSAVAPSPELVCWSRLGRGYRLGGLDELFEARDVIELRGRVLAAEDIGLYRAELADWGRHPRVEWQEFSAEWVQANDLCRRDILDRLAEEAPLPAAAFEDTCEVPWRSTGWTNNQNVVRLIDFMESRGEVAVAARGERGERLWDLAERIYPETEVVPIDDALRARAERSLHALGLIRPKVYDLAGVSRPDVEPPGEPAVIEGVRGKWRVDPAQLDASFRGRTTLLSPLDQLVFDRKRMSEIFEFDYQLEMYKPKAKRRWGYYALPVLHGDRLVGKVDAAADRPRGRLVVHAIHEDEPFTASLRTAVCREIDSLAARLGLRAEH